MREKYDYEPEREDDEEGTDTFTSWSGDEDSSTFFTDAGETPDVLADSLEDKDPSKLEALAERTRRTAEEVEEIEVKVGRKEYLEQDVSEEALEEDEREETEESEKDELEERKERLEGWIDELKDIADNDEIIAEARKLKKRGEAARNSPVLSFSDYRFETTRYFNVVEERLSDVGFEVEIDDKAVEIDPGDWKTERNEESAVLTAKAKPGGWMNKKKVKTKVQIHPHPEDFGKGGNVVVGHDTDLKEVVTRFMREDVPEEYYLLVLAVPASVSELPDKAVERVKEFVDVKKSLVVVDMENAEVIYNDTDEVAETLSRKEILNPETHEAEVSRLSNTLEEKMISGDEMPASEAAEQHDVSEKVATRAFSDVAESHSEFSVLTEKVPEPILVRW